jgi:protein phosphatase PTC1
MIVRFNKSALMTATKEPASAIGVEGDPNSIAGKISEADKIVGEARRKVQEEGVPGIGVSGSNSGKGHELKMPKEEEEIGRRRNMEKVVEEEPSLVQSDGSPEVELVGAEATNTEATKTSKLPEGELK